MNAPRFAAYSAQALGVTGSPSGTSASPRQGTKQKRRGLRASLLAYRHSQSSKAMAPPVVFPPRSTAGHRRWAAWT
jgi:hypothetical protein